MTMARGAAQQPNPREPSEPQGPLCPHNHLVQFYESDLCLIASIADFIVPALNRGEGAIVIATGEHLDSVRSICKERGIKLSEFIERKQLYLLDAHQTLSQFMVGELPNAALFDAALGRLVADLNHRFGNIAAFGEMVDVLWRQNNLDGTLALEELWNKLSLKHRFALLCGYAMSSFHDQKHGEAFRQVCSAHSQVIPVEDFVVLQSSDSQRRMIASLQQKAKALESEVAARKRVEESLQNALHLRDEFLIVASHELNTPLTALRLHLHLADRTLLRVSQPEALSTSVSNELHRLLANCETQSLRISKLIDQMMDLSRMQHGRMTLVRAEHDLTELVKASILKASDEKILGTGDGPHRGPMTLTGNTTLIAVFDRDRVEQAFGQILNNAIKFGMGRPIQIKVLLSNDGEWARISVRDEGIGIEQQDLVRIFGRFERAVSASHFAGLGIGLHFADQVARAHGGCIEVESKLGLGSEFTMILPTKNVTTERTSETAAKEG